MIYEYRDSRDGEVFASEYGQGMSATKMMYTAMSYDVPMCRVEWRRYCEGNWGEWVKLVPGLEGAIEYRSWLTPYVVKMLDSANERLAQMPWRDTA